jgi:hypothetical protein
MAIERLKHGTLAGVMVVAALSLLSCTASTGTDSSTQRVTINGRTFELELALDDDARYKGLSGREQIAADGGMLFVFPYPRQTQFVMRDCLVPIDLIFLGPGGEVVAMYHMQVEPLETRSKPQRWYSSELKTQYVLELKGGTLDDLNLNRGDRVELPFDALKARAR